MSRIITVQRLSRVVETISREGDRVVYTTGERHVRESLPVGDSALALVRPRHLQRQLVGVGLDEGSVLGVEDGRSVSWPVDLLLMRDALRRCEEGGCLLQTDTAYIPQPLYCRRRLCPRCARLRIGRWVSRWLPFFEAAARDGAALYHITLTQPTDPGDGALVLPEESRKYRGYSGPAFGVLPAVGGESLTGSYHRLRDAFDSLREDRATRGLWRDLVPGYVYGIEWTLRASSARGPQVPRWHCHLHLLAVVPGGWRHVARSWSELRRAWCRLSGGSRQAQSFQVADPGAISEVIKYPTKVPDLTLAATCEHYASARGLRPHHVAGALHSRSARYREEPWSSWLAERVDPPSWPRLRYRLPGGEWEDYLGQVRTGEFEWSAGKSDLVIVADASMFYDMLQSGLVDEDSIDLDHGELEVE